MFPTTKMLLSRLLLAVRGAASGLLFLCWPAPSSLTTNRKCFRRLACHSCVVLSLVSALLLLQASHHVTFQSRHSPSRQTAPQRLRQTGAGTGPPDDRRSAAPGWHGVSGPSAPARGSRAHGGEGREIHANGTGEARAEPTSKARVEDLGGWWHRVAETNTYLLSAHLDDRYEAGPFVRILTVSPRKEDPDLCCTHWRHGRRNTTIRIYERELHPAHYGYRYAVHSLLCPMPPGHSAPDRVSVALCTLDPPPESDRSASLLVHRPAGPKVEFAVCLPMLFGRYDRLLHLLQSVEFYGLLGASLVTVYNHSLGPNVDAALRLYAEAGLASVLPWPVSEHLNASTGWRLNRNPGDVHYYGQIGCVTDCLYRSAHRARWVFVNDVDEVVVPHAFPDWRAMVGALSPAGDGGRFSALTFENGVFPLEPHAVYRRMPPRACVADAEPGSDVDYLRTRRLATDGAATKVLVDPRAVVHLGVHRADTLVDGARVLKVPEGAALLHHYKSVGAALSLPGAGTATEDRAALRYGERLLGRVRAMLARLCAQGGPRVVLGRPKRPAKSARRPPVRGPKT